MSDATTLAGPAAVPETRLFGVAAEFDDVEGLMAAAVRSRDAGYRKMDAYTPFPVEDLDEALGFEPTRLGWVALGAGISGLLGGFWLQWYANVHYYALNIGGKPLNSWPNWIVIMYECTILFAAFAAGLFMLGRNGLPRPYHSIFNTPNFEHASRDKFFLCIEARDPKFDADAVRAFLAAQSPTRVSDVER